MYVLLKYELMHVLVFEFFPPFSVAIFSLFFIATTAILSTTSSHRVSLPQGAHQMIDDSGAIPITVDAPVGRHCLLRNATVPSLFQRAAAHQLLPFPSCLHRGALSIFVQLHRLRSKPRCLLQFPVPKQPLLTSAPSGAMAGPERVVVYSTRQSIVVERCRPAASLKDPANEQS